MTKDVKVTVLGRDTRDPSEDAAVRETADGRYYFRDGEHFLFYEHMGKSCRIRCSEDVLSVRTVGDVASRMEFREGARGSMLYTLPQGELAFENMTRRLTVETEEGLVRILAVYGLMADGEESSERELEILIRALSGGTE